MRKSAIPLFMIINTKNWISCLAVLCLAMLGGLPQSVAQPPEAMQAEVRGILKGMADLERQLEAARQAQREEKTRLDQTGRSLESIESRLREREGLHEETKDFLEQLDSRRQRQAQALDAQIVESRRLIEVSGEMVRRSMSLLYGLEKSPQTRHAELLTLALMLNTQHTRAQAESNRVLRLETERAELTENRALADVAARQHSIFTEYGLEQLHKRHKELADQLAARQVESAAKEETVRNLTQRREQLQSLMTSLVESDSRDASSETVKPSVPVPVDPGELTPESGTDAGGPMVSQTVESTASGSADSMSTEGARTLFWRAEPIGICAMASGEVVFAGPFAGYRHLLIINHGAGWRTLYGNMISAVVVKGDTVAVGQQIGIYQAGSGQRAEPFWFEVRQGKDAVNPDGWSSLPSQWRQKLFMRLGGQ